MAAIKQLAAVTRSGIGKGAARSVRREGRVPGVVYGGGEAAEPISVDFKDLNKFIYSGQFPRWKSCGIRVFGVAAFFAFAFKTGQVAV